MAELDRLKEEVGHLKVWEGIGVVIVASLAGWLASTGDKADAVTFVLAIAGVAWLGIGTLIAYRQIAERIDQIGKL